ncbi:hypothetical protein GCM10023310_36890 [Paenibacillus vulneris]|uniref:Uncharacterized protein n=1 Tax=Paenibacillus vulneris TaxID=1133364 RepID=A0ABW3USH1_9BACL
MNTTDAIALTNVVITASGVLVTGFFSFLVWKATKETANVARSSHLLAEQIDMRLREMRSNTKEIYYKLIISNADYVWKFLMRPNDDKKLLLDQYNALPKTPGISTEKIAEYFNKEEKDLILGLWKKFDSYIKDYWTDEYGNIGEISLGRGVKDAEINANKLANEFAKFIVSNRAYLEEGDSLK